MTARSKQVWADPSGEVVFRTRRLVKGRVAVIQDVAYRRSITISDIEMFRNASSNQRHRVLALLRERLARTTPRGLTYVFALLGPVAALLAVVLAPLIPSPQERARQALEQSAGQYAEILEALGAATREQVSRFPRDSEPPLISIFGNPFESAIQTLWFVITALLVAGIITALISFLHLTPSAARLEAWIAAFEDIGAEPKAEEPLVAVNELKLHSEATGLRRWLPSRLQR